MRDSKVTARNFLDETAKWQAEHKRAAEAAESRRSAEAAAREAKLAAEAERDALAAKVQAARNGALVALLSQDLVDVLAPAHDRRSCSDSDTRNAVGECSRCTLLSAQRNGFLDAAWSFSTSRA